MAKRIENPSADDLGEAGIELNDEEFEVFLAVLGKGGLNPSDLATIRQMGFFAPIRRAGFEGIFQAFKVQSDVQVLAVCREGCLDAMQGFIISMCRDGTWPTAAS
jgi:hypothetical protein